jgi:uncharacterized membrane protein YeaQ/YmgE (transglycosylase-associated protein family)
MSIVGWLAFGLLAGIVANKIVDTEAGGRRGGILLDLTLGVIGAIGGGAMFNSFGDVTIGSFNLFSMLIAIIGAVVVLLTYHALFVYRGNFDN